MCCRRFMCILSFHGRNLCHTHNNMPARRATHFFPPWAGLTILEGMADGTPPITTVHEENGSSSWWWFNQHCVSCTDCMWYVDRWIGRQAIASVFGGFISWGKREIGMARVRNWWTRPHIFTANNNTQPQQEIRTRASLSS